MSKPVKISTVLTRAAKYIEEHGWAQHTFFKARNHRTMYPGDNEEWADFTLRAKAKKCSACALGALYVGAEGNDHLAVDASNYLSKVIGRPFIPLWNDETERTQDEVVQTLKDAAKAARKDGK